MIRYIRSAAIGLTLVAGTAALATAQGTQAAPQRAEQPTMREHMGQRLGRALFHGIALTDVEKARVRAVHEQYKPELKQLRESAKPQLAAMRAARQKADTATARALWAKSAETRAQGAAIMERMRVDLRAALAPEHQAQFDENLARLKQRIATRAARVRKQGGRPSQPKSGV